MRINNELLFSYIIDFLILDCSNPMNTVTRTVLLYNKFLQIPFHITSFYAKRRVDFSSPFEFRGGHPSFFPYLLSFPPSLPPTLPPSFPLFFLLPKVWPVMEAVFIWWRYNVGAAWIAELHIEDSYLGKFPYFPQALQEWEINFLIL